MKQVLLAALLVVSLTVSAYATCGKPAYFVYSRGTETNGNLCPNLDWAYPNQFYQGASL